MAVLALRINGPRVGDYEYRIEIQDQDAARVLRAYGAEQGAVTETDENGNTVTRPRTPQEVVEGIAKGFQAGVFNNVKRWEEIEAARIAVEGVTPIDPLGATPVINGVDPDGNVVNDIAAKSADTGYFGNIWNAIKGA